MINGIFTNPAFGFETLTSSILNMPIVPGRVGAMGLFTSGGVNTLSIDLEMVDGVLKLIPNTKRGGPAAKFRTNKRNMRTLKIPHFPLDDSIGPDEVQGVRVFGSTSELAGAKMVVDQRLAGMATLHDATLEYGRMGAVKGVIYDADGSTVIYDLFDEFGVEQDTVNFVLGTAGTNVKGKCLEVKRLVEKGLGNGVVYDHIHCFAGDDWFDAFINHANVKTAYERWADSSGQVGAFLRDDNRKGFYFGGIYFENYIGSVGDVDFVAANEAHFFPVGAPGLFKTVFAPGHFMETANTVGLPRYARGEATKMGRGFDLTTESNPLSYCEKPKCLVKGSTS